MAKRSNVAVIIPTLNEQKTIGSTLRELRKVFEDASFFVADGNSYDDTVGIAKELGAEVIRQNGRGKGAALRQTFDYEGLNSDFVVMMDADGSMDPGEAPLFIRALERGADVAKGSRFLSDGYSEDLSIVRRIGNQILVSLVNLFWSSNYTDLCYGFMAFRKEALEKLSSRLSSKNFEIETEICIKVKKLGFNVVEIPSVERARRHGRSNLNTFRDGFRILRRIVRELLLEQ